MVAYRLRNVPAYTVPLSQDELQLLGLVCAVYAQVEAATDVIIAYLAKVPNHNTLCVMLGRREMRGKIDMMKDLAETSANSAIWPDLQPVYRTLLKYIPKRNIAVHGIWAEGIPATPPQPATPPTAILQLRGRMLPASELEAIAENLAIVSCHLNDIHWRHAVDPGAASSPWSGILGPLDPL